MKKSAKICLNCIKKLDKCIMDGVKFEFNDIISLCMKDDSERRQIVSRLQYFILYFKLFLLPTLAGRLKKYYHICMI